AGARRRRRLPRRRRPFAPAAAAGARRDAEPGTRRGRRRTRCHRVRVGARGMGSDMSKIRNVLVGVIAGALLAGGGAAAAWWSLRASQGDEATLLREQAQRHPPRYVSLEKVIVMLRREPGDPRS